MHCALLLLLLLTPFQAATKDARFSSHTSERYLLNAVLKDLGAVQVVFEELDADAVNGGLSIESVRTDVELRLRIAGVRVLTTDQARSQPECPLLHVGITTKFGNGVVIYNVVLELMEEVVLKRRNSSTGIHFATTWTTPGRFGAIGAEKMPGTIRNALRDLADMFCNAYLTANARR